MQVPDLGSLGLCDQAVSADNTTKLSKIGSDKFKDVLVGSLKGQRFPSQSTEGDCT
jgi:hypothetical protein